MEWFSIATTTGGIAYMAAIWWMVVRPPYRRVDRTS